ncbi:MAG TPA: NAD(P)-dependent oxidoreductase [Candidatus Mailhella merdavium]|nr:NAD(P)-dependent oxidoreductase [Candidatus Mailhella merdavium]
MKFAFLGLGNMGRPVARNIIRLGYDVLLYDLLPENIEKAREAGPTGRAASSPDEAADCDVVCTCLRMPDDVTGLMMGENGLYSKMKKGAIHVDFSTIDGPTTLKLEKAANELGLGYIQCTQGKTPQFAERREQILYVGGKPDVVDKLWEPVFSKVAQPIRMKTAEAASSIKLITNMMSGVILAAIAESIRLGEETGMSGEEVVELCKATGCNSHHLQIAGASIAKRDLPPVFALDLERKDMRLACEMARSKGLNLTVSESAFALFNKAHDAGFGNWGAGAIIKVVD